MDRKARIAVSAIFFINGFSYANWISRLPRFQEQYDMDNGALGMVLLAHAIGALCSMPLAGWLIVKNGSRRVTIFALFAFCGMIPFMAVMPNMWLLGLWYGIMGAASGVLDVAMNAQAVLVERRLQQPIMSSFHAVFSGGMMMGAAMGTLFIFLEQDLVAHLLIIGLLNIPLALWSIRPLLLDEVQASEAKETGGFRLPDPSLLGIGLIAFCCMLGEGAMADWSTNYMERIARAKESIAPFGLAAFSTAMMIGRIFGDRARLQLGDSKLLVYSSLMALLGLLITLLWISVPVLILGFFLVGIGLAVIVPIAYSVAGNAKGLAPGLGISMVTTIGYSGFLFGPPIIGFLADWQSLRIAFGFVLLLFVMMTLLSFWNSRRAKA